MRKQIFLKCESLSIMQKFHGMYFNLTHKFSSMAHVPHAHMPTCTHTVCETCEIHDYISITIVQSYTGKYHVFVAVCIVTSVQHEY